MSPHLITYGELKSPISAFTCSTVRASHGVSGVATVSYPATAASALEAIIVPAKIIPATAVTNLPVRNLRNLKVCFVIFIHLIICFLFSLTFIIVSHFQFEYRPKCNFFQLFFKLISLTFIIIPHSESEYRPKRKKFYFSLLQIIVYHILNLSTDLNARNFYALHLFIIAHL